MRKVLAVSTVAILIGISSGCGPSENTQDDSRTEAEQQQALRDSTFGSLAESLDRAEEAEQLQQDRKDRIDAALESSGAR